MRSTQSTRITIALFVMGTALALPVPANATPKCFGKQATRVGTPGRDVITLNNNQDDVVVSLGGNDDVSTNGGGDDLVCSGKGADHVTGAHKTDGGPGRDRLRGVGNLVFGGTGNDVLRGSGGLVAGGEGDDIVRGDNFRTERLVGGAGADELIGVNSFNEDLEQGDVADYTSSDRAVKVDLRDGTAEGAGHDMLTNIPTVVGSRFGDRLFGSNGFDHLDGKNGGDLLAGRGEGDFLEGGSGNDRMEGGDGYDLFEGEMGSDLVKGGQGVDLVDYRDAPGGIRLDLELGESSGWGKDSIFSVQDAFGSLFQDVLKGSSVGNELYGFDARDGRDRLLGAGGADVLHGVGDERDESRGGTGSDTYDPDSVSGLLTVDLEKGTSISNAATDHLSNIENVDAEQTQNSAILKGDDGPNRLISSDGQDLLIGRGGDDFLDANENVQNDEARGGSGTDTCEDAEETRGCEVITP